MAKDRIKPAGAWFLYHSNYCKPVHMPWLSEDFKYGQNDLWKRGNGYEN